MAVARAAITKANVLAVLVGLGTVVTAPPAAACGGFFCGQLPVDQTAERILFEVGQDTVTMTTQISFSGAAEDFAWVLPLSEVPLADSLAVWPQEALAALDANSGPVFLPPNDGECLEYFGCSNCARSTAVPEEAGGDPSVTVHIRAEVGDYSAAVIESEDPAALIEWLRTEGYRVTPAMEPYIERYTSEGLAFLALKLLDTADVSDLEPFRFTLPGTTPTIPLRMTALAAEPEMSILVFVLADQRFEGKNWANLEIPEDRIRYNQSAFFRPGLSSTNWPRLVAQAVDEAGGQGWVTEFAGPSSSYADLVRTQVQNGNFPTPEAEEAAAKLLALFEAHPYLTRLYTRLSAEEMTGDPAFGRSALGDVVRERRLSRFVDGADQCSYEVPTSFDPCDFATCGAGGLCRPVGVVDNRVASAGVSVELMVPGCACLPGATARATIAPDGSPVVICQDGRMSFVNAGDRDVETGDVLPDACAGFDCGEHGQCTAMNMTPTCVCDRTYVAIGRLDPTSGALSVRCEKPREGVPADFYDKRLPGLPEDLPGGREVTIPSVVPPAPSPDVMEPVAAGFPMPRANPDVGGVNSPLTSARTSSDGCTLRPTTSSAKWLGALLLAVFGVRRRRGLPGR